MGSPRTALRDARRVVIKVGTAVVSRDDGGVALGRLGALVERIRDLRSEGREVLLVSSGAIGLGVERLGFDKRPTNVADLAACAAAGQGLLMGLYDSFFSHLGLRVAQVLLTEDDFHRRHRYVTLAATLERLLALGAVPLINENDVVSTDHLAVFGDNDHLAALVAANTDCDALALLSDVDAVYTQPPSEPGAERIPVYDEGQQVVVGGTSAGGRGGMGSKVAAAEVAARSGVTTVIATGLDASVLSAAFAGVDVGTVFPARRRPNRRRRWLAFATAPVGRIEVNAGAHEAMVERQASLLAPGVVGVDGEWEAGEVVSLVFDGREFARGVCAQPASRVREAMGRPVRGKALVRRNYSVILEER